MKKLALLISLVASVAIIAFTVSIGHNNRSETIVFEQNVEALTIGEVDLDKLKEMLNQTIWRFTMSSWTDKPDGFAIHCETSGCLQCFVPGLS